MYNKLRPQEEISNTSVQMAIYSCLPNEENNGYLRHRDSFKVKSLTPNTRMRKLTLITYLNNLPIDCGGCLRLFLANDETIDVVPR